MGFRLFRLNSTGGENRLSTETVFRDLPAMDDLQLTHLDTPNLSNKIPNQMVLEPYSFRFS